jgi:hypothetical protein
MELQSTKHSFSFELILMDSNWVIRFCFSLLAFFLCVPNRLGVTNGAVDFIKFMIYETGGICFELLICTVWFGCIFVPFHGFYLLVHHMITFSFTCYFVFWLSKDTKALFGMTWRYHTLNLRNLILGSWNFTLSLFIKIFLPLLFFFSALIL